jgi:hypothetical protein
VLLSENAWAFLDGQNSTGAAFLDMSMRRKSVTSQPFYNKGERMGNLSKTFANGAWGKRKRRELAGNGR